MISLRYHIISIAAVFLALAVGIVLGSSTLSRTLLSGLSEDRDELAKQVADLQAERNGLNARLAGSDGFAGSIGPMAVRGELDQRTVVLVTTSDARPADRDAVKALIGNAGGTVSGELQLTEAFADPQKVDQLRDVVTRLLPAGLQLPTASDPGTLAGGLLGALVLINKDTSQPQAQPNETAAALTGLADGGFIRMPDTFQPGQLALILTGSALAGNGAGDRASTIARFATQIDRSGAGAVLAGATGSADATGPVGVARADTAATAVLSTVDNADLNAGRIATVLALSEQLEGKAGRYGYAGTAQSVVP
ncbi:copper transporter [Kibdelosporangium persicum]|uniref:Copper transport outer membrane protein MctB n=1 Tax=Kibdelosporangium persicum TaxID=2698649 RepID=A0ABX2FI76_9PSEU|nr:copper transporter [Kibdelosporangium persicum]NRN70438.1 Copper transport outer membrane protein MctB [Kibdelosporangium persicum]